MTGDIRDLLLSSEAVASLRMEARIAKAFTQLGWEVERSAYYTDTETGKIREIDVLASKTIDRPRRRKGIGAPLINFEVLCECKNLNGKNLIFEASHTSEQKHLVQQYWVGFEDELRPIVSAIAKDARIEDPARLQALYNYVIDRAYPVEGRALRHWVVMPAPPTEIVARAYRETKMGKVPDESNLDGKRINPSWSAVLSTLSAIRAAKVRTKNSVLSYLDTREIGFLGVKHFVQSSSFFLDAQLLRYVFFHPFIILNAKIWNLEESEMNEVG